MKKITLFVIGLFVAGMATAQTANEIVDGYIEATGGYEAWDNIKNLKIKAKVNQGGLEIPIEVVNMKDGRQYTKFTVQGNDFMQGVFDGETLWSTNFQSTKPEKADAESTANQKLEANDFPSDLFNYEDKGYTLELEGEETIEGTEAYKLKLTKEPITVDGEEVEDVVYFFFDKESNVLLAQEESIVRGPQKGAIAQTVFSDYDEVEGVYFPFSISQGIKGVGMQPLIIDSIEANVEIDETMFAFPEEAGE
ncbi:outer membrane lipoprotein-sorting protein [Fulvivirga lutea]|uniref:Outer membrane lipoprotein-sorting protein n=1 Tax=Fulvivirga lutea TaxID=2810512 RepID=A0A974WFJ0_9BACT|nr:outer membrane lipoprotein-sorting protein [Fulvivirga lutea]QSE96578.1 outer membrane lipoprotein-sorting protein [Fulvivirga lutea]